MLTRRALLFILFAALICCNSTTIFAEAAVQLQLTMIGNGVGPYYALAGQSTQLKIEIFNVGPNDVFLIQGEAYLDPELNGNWQLAHSEDLGNFHLTKLESAVWTFNLQMPSHIQAQNLTNGVPQVELLAKIAYSTNDGKHSATSQFLLSVPGAATKQIDYSIYQIVLGVVLITLAVIIVKNAKSRSIRKAQS